MAIKTKRLAIGILTGVILTTSLAYVAAAGFESQAPACGIHRSLSWELTDSAVNYGRNNKITSYLTFAKGWNTAENGGMAGNNHRVYAICKTPYFVLADAARTAAREERELSQGEITAILDGCKNRLVFMAKFYGDEINFFGKDNIKAVIKQGDKSIYASSSFITVFNKDVTRLGYMPVYNAGGSFEFDTSGLDYTQNFDFYLIPIEGPKFHFPIYVTRIH